MKSVRGLGFWMVVVIGCSNPAALDLDYEVRPGVVEFFGDSLRLELPESAVAGVPFALTVFTFGNGCVSGGPTPTQLDGMRFTMEPMDSVVVSPDVACPDILLTFEHTTTAVFDDPGIAFIEVVGLRQPGDALVRLEREIEVR